MRKSIRRIVALTFAVLLLCSLFPFSCFAVDPVSAATMANALAQAITAYGASNGVSMMYDVTSADGIGEAMHDLWGQFKTDVNDNNVPTYDSLAVTIWSTVFKKVGNNVAINLSDTVVSYLDAFWNWLLSGPAEMQKVDDQYYQWSVNSQSGVVEPIVIGDYSSYYIDGNEVLYVVSSYAFVDSRSRTWIFSFSSPCYIYMYGSPYPGLIGLSESPCTITRELVGDSSYDSVSSSSSVSYDWYENSGQSIRSDSGIPSYPSLWLPSGPPSSSITSDMKSLSVLPYIGDTVPQDVYIPDNEDVNYQPLPYVGPLDIPWDQTWGDGETITDAQGTSIADALDNAIADDGTLTLEGDDVVNPPADDVIGGPDSYQVPGLADVFPFCIPFDIYNFLSALVAQPTAPYFEAELAFPEAIGGTQTIEIDFDTPTWNQLAQLLRLLELLAFIVGLALLTRSMFIRG